VDIYLDLLELFVFPKVDDIERENATDWIPNPWTARNGSMFRHPRSPNLITPDFFT
jgi:hypothetical protein